LIRRTEVADDMFLLTF